MTDFYRRRRAIAPPPAAPPEPIGWNPAGTATGNPAPPPVGADRFDTAPSRNPYPPTMPAPDVQGGGGPGDVDVHVRALRHVEHVAHDTGFIVAGGDLARLGDLQTAILRRKAMREELGTGVVLLTPAELEILERSIDDGDEVAA